MAESFTSPQGTVATGARAFTGRLWRGCRDLAAAALLLALMATQRRRRPTFSRAAPSS